MSSPLTCWSGDDDDEPLQLFLLPSLTGSGGFTGDVVSCLVRAESWQVERWSGSERRMLPEAARSHGNRLTYWTCWDDRLLLLMSGMFVKSWSCVDTLQLSSFNTLNSLAASQSPCWDRFVFMVRVGGLIPSAGFSWLSQRVFYLLKLEMNRLKINSISVFQVILDIWNI